jgi:antirestriction protein ArdC
LLEQAVNDPGILSSAYRNFHQYSIGNQLLAWAQCVERRIQPGPIATFPKWKELGRFVRRGEKAITLCQPVTVKRTVEDGQQEDHEIALTRFVYRPHWFVLAQTEGQAVPEPMTPTWNAQRALAALDVTEVPFDHTDGNCLGLATMPLDCVSRLSLGTRFA